MSFSFASSGKTKQDVVADVSAQMDKVIQNQPHHAHDKDAVVSCVGTYIDLLDGKTDEDTISISVSGSLGWNADQGEGEKHTGAGLSISARIYKQA